MNNKATLAQHQAGPYQVDMEQYQAITAELESYLDTFAAPLQTIARPSFDKLIQGEFSQVASLLPYWLSDLLPVAPKISHQLGVAHLYFWWYYYIQDEIIDDDISPAALLSGHLALLKMVDTYEALGVTRLSCWADYHRLALLSAEAHAIELQSRFTDLATLTPEQLEPITLEFIANRVAPVFFNTMAQLDLAGIPAQAPLRNDLITALRCFAIARQLGDDASDWLTDLKAGHLNYVSARLLRRLYQQESATAGFTLNLERLVGYQLRDETFWTEIEQTTQKLGRQALACLAPYGNCRLQTFIQHQMNQQELLWTAGCVYRANCRHIFGVAAV